MLNVLITGAALSDPGGVAALYNALLPHLSSYSDLAVRYLEIGTTRNAGGVLHPVLDQLRVRHEIRKRHPDIVHINPSLNRRSFIRDALAIAHAKQAGSRVIVFFHGWDDDFASKLETHALWLFRRTYGTANAFVVLGQKFERKLREWGINTQIYHSTTTVADSLLGDLSLNDVESRHSSGSPLRVLFMSRLIAGKGIAETLAAVGLLRRRGVPITLTVAGDGAGASDARQVAAMIDPEGAFVHFVGDVRGAPKRELLASHHVFCFPSYSEGMPNAVLEAMAFGLAVVTCPVGGIADFFEDGQMGFLVAPRSDLAVVDALSSMAHDRQRVAIMGRYNYHYATKVFRAPKVAQNLAGIYRDVCG